LCYVEGTLDFGLYLNTLSIFDLISYTYANWEDVPTLDNPLFKKNNFFLSKPHNSRGNYKEINQNSLVFHSKTKQKNYKEENKLRKHCEASSFLLEACVFYLDNPVLTTTVLSEIIMSLSPLTNNSSCIGQVLNPSRKW